MTFEKFKRILPIRFLIGVFLGCIEFAVMQYASIHLSWIVISGFLGIALSICAIPLIHENLPSPEEKLIHFIGHVIMFSGVILIGFLGIILY